MTVTIGRRELLAALGGAAAWPLAARAQQAAMPVIGFLHPASPDAYEDRLRSFRQGLKDAGFIDGENVAIDYRWADNQIDRLSTLAAELVRRQVAVIVAGTTSAAFAAKAATTTVPIVFSSPEDPVGLRHRYSWQVVSAPFSLAAKSRFPETETARGRDSVRMPGYADGSPSNWCCRDHSAGMSARRATPMP